MSLKLLFSVRDTSDRDHENRAKKCASTLDSLFCEKKQCPKIAHTRCLQKVSQKELQINKTSIKQEVGFQALSAVEQSTSLIGVSRQMRGARGCVPQPAVFPRGGCQLWGRRFFNQTPVILVVPNCLYFPKVTYSSIRAGSSGSVHNVVLMNVYLDLETPGGRDFG